MKLKKTIATIKIVVMSATTGMSIPEAEIYEEILQIKMTIAAEEIKGAMKKTIRLHNSLMQKMTSVRRIYVERFG